MSTNLDYDEFDRTPRHEGVSDYPDERFTPVPDSGRVEHDPSAYGDPTHHDADVAPVAAEPDTNEYGVTRATDEHVGDEKPVVAEGLGEHRPGESLGEWLRNDLEQTKADLHIGGANKDSS
jgi:hypothetical protein